MLTNTMLYHMYTLCRKYTQFSNSDYEWIRMAGNGNPISRANLGKPKGAKSKLNKIKEAVLAAHGADAIADPMQFLAGIMADEKASRNDRMSAATVLMPYCHSKKPTLAQVSGEGGVPLAINVMFEAVTNGSN